ncbi:hypothetical protein AMTR_s00091p00083030 [Amborella trichopoda]|uniref:Uncharacterized protein n=1 Tax=Amborella trichopoda TaxID=13333 RepID=W1NZ11_AMBTC|nr:hypothetical protein AMTR_s00091p00083030 [Amborella trichopoda]
MRPGQGGEPQNPFDPTGLRMRLHRVHALGAQGHKVQGTEVVHNAKVVHDSEQGLRPHSQLSTQQGSGLDDGLRGALWLGKRPCLNSNFGMLMMVRIYGMARTEVCTTRLGHGVFSTLPHPMAAHHSPTPNRSKPEF